MSISQQIGAARLIQPGVIANASARPASPFEGQAIYQKDTDEVLYYNGSSWSRPWNMPWGILAATTSTNNTLTSNILVGLNTTFTAVANRYYRVSIHVATSSNIVGERLILTWTGNTVRAIDYTSGDPGFDTLDASCVQTFSAGSQTVQVTWSQIANSVLPDASAGNAHQLTIEDIGPV